MTWMRDSFITHRAFWDALAEEGARAIPNPILIQSSSPHQTQHNINFSSPHKTSPATITIPMLPPLISSNVSHSFAPESSSNGSNKVNSYSRGRRSEGIFVDDYYNGYIDDDVTSEHGFGFQDYYMMNQHPHHHHGVGEAFDGGFIAVDKKNDVGDDGGGETRDFLGLRSLMSHNEMLGFANNLGNTSASEQFCFRATRTIQPSRLGTRSLSYAYRV
ncbi:hypothetical protein DY000_02010574 [Brassica cretica]|uniref:BIRD-IDD transcription factor fourth C2HC zinc finger domain-containing protein n=1 Tax=Brassica cretica TaxID=69181 RepID=A0ABQ7CL68_BRACR|nr:hypothetical protein DY000_02010574 [Brassica cretica]